MVATHSFSLASLQRCIINLRIVPLSRPEEPERLINIISEQYILNTIGQSFVWWLLAALAFSESMKPQHTPNPTSSS